PLWTGTMWECPAFFPLGGKHVLLVSVWDDGRLHYTAAFVGTYAGHRFVPERLQKLDYGDRFFYAPQTMLDDQGRRIVFGWIPEGRDAEAQLRAGWSGVMSLPRVLSLAPDGGLHVAPAQELTALRGTHRRVTAIPIGETVPDWPDDLRGDTVEISAVIDLGNAAEVGLKVRSAPDGVEQTTIVYDRAGRRLVLNRERSSTDESAERSAHSAPLELAPGEPLVLRVFLDRSVIEVFANERVTLTSRVYPAGAQSAGITPLVRGGTAKLRELDLWQIRSIW
ncbi:MAG TPA: GH32 C-terminal domain-containing protein, partial [Herpetosiphonaceae bacterium]|nr:GH32 C-terminal domain-containing protein [Herpetosiphonaceae bacterium]